jgi:hypothetical protein
MKLGIMQPYFMPYIGYFQLIKAVDKYVVYDDVNYIKGGWVSRNNILVNGEKKMFTIILKGASCNKLFNEVYIGDDFRKLTKTLHFNYSKSPYFEPTMDLMEKIISFPNKQFALFIANSIQEILNYLSIDTDIIISSNLSKNNELKGKNKVLHICKLLGADSYYNAIGGETLYDKEDFKNHGISLNFIDTQVKEYPQLSNSFVPYLSILDVLMNNSKEEVNLLLDSYNLK